MRLVDSSPVLMCCALLATALVAGCKAPSRKAASTAPVPTQPPPGRLVPAVVAGFEHGTGSWKADSPEVKPTRSLRTGHASRGQRWLATNARNGTSGDITVDTYVDAQRLDWSKFGDALRADVCCHPAGSVHPRLYVVGPDGTEALGPEGNAGSEWSTLVWPAGPALKDLSRLGVRWRIHGKWSGELGLDNVRVGAAGGLSRAWSVAVGPFPTREAAVEGIAGLKAAGIDSFPVFAEGWYLNVGTFSTQSAAEAESRRLATTGTKTVLIQR